jgi:hypothetical protein
MKFTENKFSGTIRLTGLFSSFCFGYDPDLGHHDLKQHFRNKLYVPGNRSVHLFTLQFAVDF